MEISNFSQIYTTGGTTLILLYIIFMLAKALLKKFSVKPREEYTLASLKAQVMKLETNHLVHIQADIKEIRSRIEKVSDEQIRQGNRITALEVRTK